MANDAHMGVSPAQLSSQTGKFTCHNKSSSEQMNELHYGNRDFELSEQKRNNDAGPLQNVQGVLSSVVSNCAVNENLLQGSERMTPSVTQQLGPPPNDLGKSCQVGEKAHPSQSAIEEVHEFACSSVPDDTSEVKCQLDSQHVHGGRDVNAAATSSLVEDQLEPFSVKMKESCGNEQLVPPPEDMVKMTSSEQLETPSKNATSRQLGRRGKSTSKSLKKKYMLRSLGGNDRVLRSTTREKPKVPESITNSVNNDGEKKRKKRKKNKKRGGEVIVDEYSRIRTHLRYLLNRMNYEQNLIDAYSGEGWKGYSLDKLKPEKELQRATSEILRRKLKIRDLFQHLDSLCAEGRFPESLFDSDGQIDSEDIFCAKCGSKDLSPDNDIILCDGACDRGFHQFCLEPPLLNENIPPDDEGWLCPACNCKDDCLDLLNDSRGTHLSINDSWERIFPEAAASSTGQAVVPSDDSDDDDDYNPDVPEEEEIQGDESSSEDSEYSSAPDELEAPHNGDQYFGLPSDDSEDDDYDPDAPGHDKVKEVTSSSDFTSDSEDLAAAVEDNNISRLEQDITSRPLDGMMPLKGSRKQNSKITGKKHSLDVELSSVLESDPGQEGSIPVSTKRHVERLDYKKLYDETNQNVNSESSNDEDWTDTATPRRSERRSKEVASALPNGKAPIMEHRNEEALHTPKRSTRHNSKVEITNSLPAKSSKTGFSDAKTRSSYHKRLGEVVIQRLYKSFKENQYPDRATKESLAQELGLSSQQVSKWFENYRWSCRKSSHMEDRVAKSASRQGTRNRGNKREAIKEGGTAPECSRLEVRDTELTRESNRQKSKTRSSRKRKLSSDPQASGPSLEVNDEATRAIC
ncbi:homeobox protein HAT3.1 [Quillaja saponaria]|uniref:Homeobox protein HAT3.1 n=1 Tax=Quillaja saponaria TaxID=32244 RepID=A0AAD7M033_QUISA|nr:homeobox protein HAT3.1 [Quillaja saponaria]